VVNQVNVVLYDGKAYLDGRLRVTLFHELAGRFHSIVYLTAQTALRTEVHPVAFKGGIPECVLHLLNVSIARFIGQEIVLKMLEESNLEFLVLVYLHFHKLPQFFDRNLSYCLFDVLIVLLHFNV